MSEQTTTELEKLKSEKKELQKALLRMCEYANHMGLMVAKDYKNGNYVGDFVAQHEELLK